ncbi:low molecular weight phosphotyrosine protein phosphatase [Gleimia coleocanis DSM 15436]|uniref:protein-tyrosine-phosphatase n=2 Tax=Gleimia TaxID=2692113 RepID=C0VYD0_9ACTO|nr:low molecular weight phosphotyrosine protein phosphatase [Gleimia coleocanis DSM 15436]
MAEVVLQEHLRKAGVDAVVDSCGISDEEHGNPIDYRAQRTLKGAGYVLPNHAARQINSRDLEENDLILAMTYRHFEAVERLVNRKQTNFNLSEDVPRLMMFRAFDPQGINGEIEGAPSGTKNAPTKVKDVPDPWYGTQADFEETLATIERCIPALLAEIQRRETK